LTARIIGIAPPDSTFSAGNNWLNGATLWTKNNVSIEKGAAPLRPFTSQNR
jgi:hypothetical protein